MTDPTTPPDPVSPEEIQQLKTQLEQYQHALEQSQQAVENLTDEVKRLAFSNSRLTEQVGDVRQHQDMVVRAVTAEHDEVVEILASFENRLAPAADAGHDQKKPPPQPRPWTDRATAADIDALIDRFDKLMSLYEPTTNLRPDAGWPLHRGVVEQAAAVCTAWTAAALEDEAAREEGTGSTALADWELGVWQPMLQLISKGNSYSKGTVTPLAPWKGTIRGATYLDIDQTHTQQGGS